MDLPSIIFILCAVLLLLVIGMNGKVETATDRKTILIVVLIAQLVGLWQLWR